MSLHYMVAGYLALLIGAFNSVTLADDATSDRGKPWVRHTIDDSSRGADGVKLADVNRDGLQDIVTGWEEGGLTRVYINPGYDRAKDTWPAVTVGRTKSVEDAQLVDLDNDGQFDVVSCCEGSTRKVFIHWAPSNPDEYMNPDAWTTQSLPEADGRMAWMFCVPMQVDGRHGVDLVVGAKGSGAEIGWFESPENPRDLKTWRWHPICPAGWIMTLKTIDMDRDGDLDILTTDRKADIRACHWLENPGADRVLRTEWKKHVIGGTDTENLFLTVGDLDGDGLDDLVWAVKHGLGIQFYRRMPDEPIEGPVVVDSSGRWVQYIIEMASGTGSCKGVAVGDLNLDGRPDLVYSCESATGDLSGIVWLEFDEGMIPQADNYKTHEVSGVPGIKYDRVELLDVDGDGDLDILCCEERETSEGNPGGLGVFWHENPTR